MTMEIGNAFENTYRARTWFNKKCEDPGTRDLWMKARILYNFKKKSMTALHLFECKMSELQEQSSRALSQKETWLPEVHTAIRVLFDRIVTRWKPANLLQNFRTNPGLHDTLTPERLLDIRQIFDDSGHEFNFDVNNAQKLYEQCFIPLLYHELWESMKSDINHMSSNNIFNTNGDIRIQTTEYVLRFTQPAHPLERSVPTTLIFGSYSFQIDRSFAQNFPKLGLYDIVLINIDFQHNRQNFFGIVVHIFDDYPADITSFTNIDPNNGAHIIEVNSKVVLYTSKTCSDAVKKHSKSSEPQTIFVHKLANITSSRRQISAIYNLRQFSKQKSFLKPSNADPYFLRGGVAAIHLGSFNNKQRQVIADAEHIFNNNENTHLHLIHGPPGTGKSKTIAGVVIKLLPKLGKKGKILLCAPSNNACDELLKRILHEIGSKIKKGDFVRVGREAPFDHDVCEHFLESLTMQELVESMQNGEDVTYQTADSVKQNILKNAKVIVSTLNYSANNILVSIKKQRTVKFVIIDEACQSLEADCLLPFYFDCSKIILVGDPEQLPPCVLSTAGQNHNLSQSLYQRLDARIHRENISLLNRQYRMHEEICRFPNNHFYEGKLITDESVRDYWTEYPLQPYYLYNLIYTTHTCQPNGGSSDNQQERIFVKKFCIKLLERLVGRQPYVKNDEQFIEMEKRIVVITPYKRQMTKFRERSLEFPRHIEVITIDSAQGKEKDIVLISCVRSNIGSTGFLADHRRLNVMLTRAKRALYIFGNLTWLSENNHHWDALVDDATDRQVIDTLYNDERLDLPSYE